MRFNHIKLHQTASHISRNTRNVLMFAFKINYSTNDTLYQSGSVGLTALQVKNSGPILQAKNLLHDLRGLTAGLSTSGGGEQFLKLFMTFEPSTFSQFNTFCAIFPLKVYFAPYSC